MFQTFTLYATAPLCIAVAKCACYYVQIATRHACIKKFQDNRSQFYLEILNLAPRARARAARARWLLLRCMLLSDPAAPRPSLAWSVDVQCDTCQSNIVSAFPKVAWTKSGLHVYCGLDKIR